MKVRYLADANLNEQIVAGVLRRVPNIDFLWGGTVDLTGLPDLDILALGATENRVIVTHDIRTFPSAFAEFISTKESGGVVLIPQQLPVGIGIQSLIRIWEEFTAHEWINRIVRVPF